ncbi:MAG: beta-mannosidase [Ruminococcus sp.]|nr:beta-mannosidase [Ruminococcus sp.]
MSDKLYEPVVKGSQECVRNVLKYLSDISGDRIVTGQHTQTMEMEELSLIRKVTGKEPALLGFEMLSYSPNINFTDTDEECINEVLENNGTLRRAYEWAEKKGLITLTLHWFSPLYGRSKSFFTRNTDFDAKKAIQEGSRENKALIQDIDHFAALLRPFCEKGIPILWRPFHECDGDWFWWGANGPDVVKALWKIMFERFTVHHGLNDLIWVWNAAKAEFYPGDEYVDIISRDLYPEKHTHSACDKEYRELISFTNAPKIALLGETGTLPDPTEIHNKKTGWASYMTWSKPFCLTEEFNSFEYLKKVYDDPYAVTLESLPELY